jgi:prevent-host-death family protein
LAHAGSAKLPIPQSNITLNDKPMNTPRHGAASTSAHMNTVKWSLQEAKNNLSEVVRRPRQQGPQMITLHGADAVVVVD